MSVSSVAGRTADEIAPVCLDRPADFATSHDLAFDPARVTFAERWAGAGHEVRRLPGMTARIAVDHCGGVLAVDLGKDCEILKSRGEGGCKGLYPPTFY